MTEEIANIDANGRMPDGSPFILSSALSAYTALINLRLTGISGLAGTLPPSYSLLTQLTRISLEFSNIQGSLPAQWSSMLSLSGLSLSWMPRLTGTFPAQWSTLVNLVAFNFDQGSLGGPIPYSYSALTALTFIGTENFNVCGRDIPLFSQLGLPLMPCPGQPTPWLSSIGEKAVPWVCSMLVDSC